MLLGARVLDDCLVSLLFLCDPPVSLPLTLALSHRCRQVQVRHRQSATMMIRSRRYVFHALAHVSFMGAVRFDFMFGMRFVGARPFIAVANSCLCCLFALQMTWMALKADGGEQTSSFKVQVPHGCSDLDDFRTVLQRTENELKAVVARTITFTLLRSEDNWKSWTSEDLRASHRVPTTDDKNTLLLVKYPPSSKSSPTPPSVSCCHLIGVEGRRFRAMMSLTPDLDCAISFCRRFRAPHRRHDGPRGDR